MVGKDGVVFSVGMCVLPLVGVGEVMCYVVWCVHHFHMAVAVVGVQWRQSWRVWNLVMGRRGMCGWFLIYLLRVSRLILSSSGIFGEWLISGMNIYALGKARVDV